MKFLYSLVALAFAWNLTAIANDEAAPTAEKAPGETTTTETEHHEETGEKVATKKHPGKAQHKTHKKTSKTTTEKTE